MRLPTDQELGRFFFFCHLCKQSLARGLWADLQSNKLKFPSSFIKKKRQSLSFVFFFFTYKYIFVRIFNMVFFFFKMEQGARQALGAYESVFYNKLIWTHIYKLLPPMSTKTQNQKSISRFFDTRNIIINLKKKKYIYI